MPTTRLTSVSADLGPRHRLPTKGIGTEPPITHRRITGVITPGFPAWRRWLPLSDSAELLHQLIQLRDVVIDVFVAVLRIEVAHQFGRFVGRDLLRSRLNVVADLVARFVVAAAREGELVGRGAVAASAGDLLRDISRANPAACRSSSASRSAIRGRESFARTRRASAGIASGFPSIRSLIISSRKTRWNFSSPRDLSAPPLIMTSPSVSSSA